VWAPDESSWTQPSRARLAKSCRHTSGPSGSSSGKSQTQTAERPSARSSAALRRTSPSAIRTSGSISISAQCVRGRRDRPRSVVQVTRHGGVTAGADLHDHPDAGAELALDVDLDEGGYEAELHA